MSDVGVCVVVIAFSFIECSDSTDDGPGFSSPIYEKKKLVKGYRAGLTFWPKSLCNRFLGSMSRSASGPAEIAGAMFVLVQPVM